MFFYQFSFISLQVVNLKEFWKKKKTNVVGFHLFCFLQMITFKKGSSVETKKHEIKPEVIIRENFSW